MRLLVWLLLATTILLGPTAPAVAAEPEWVERQTEHLVLRFAPADDAEVLWYAGFVEDAYRYVVDVFGHEPRPGIVLTFYSDEDAYAAANPLAGREEGVLAHARPGSREIGLALGRLRKQSEILRRDAIRHELTHVVLGEMSGNKLPIGFHEGLAQYLEQDVDQRAKLASLLRRGAEAGQLLSLTDLNRQRAFLSRAAVAYPQSYSVVVFLTERYGFGHLVRLVLAVREVDGLEEAVQWAFGRSLAELEAEWQVFLPGYLESGWRRNDLDLWDMAEPRRLFAEGKYAEAQDGFRRAARLFADLGRGEKLEQAETYLRQSGLALEAVELDRRGSVALESHDYAAAADLLGQAETRWSSLSDEARRQSVRANLDQARRGLAAIERLGEARELLDGWRLPEARTTALEAGLTFAELGDAGRTEEANDVLAAAQALQMRLGMATIGVGATGLVASGLLWQVGRRRRSREGRESPAIAYRPQGGLAVQEHDWSL